MKHKTIQFLLVFWTLGLLTITLWQKLAIDRTLENYMIAQRDQSQFIMPDTLEALADELHQVTIIPQFLFSILTLAAVLFILSRIFADLRHATNAARYSLDQPYRDTYTLLPLDRSGETAALQAAVQDLGAKARFAIGHQKDEKIRLKDYLSDVSHQLKTPLASLRLYNDLLDRRIDTLEADQRSFVQAQAKQIERMEWLISDLMTLARLDADAVEMSLVDTKLRPTLELAAQPFWARAMKEEKQLTVRCSPKIEVPHDRKWVAEAIANVIKNALEHTENGGQVEVNCSGTPLTVQIDILDNGKGIDEDDLPRIFDRFYGKKTALHPDSIGIGLSLSRMILSKNHAEIYAENRVSGGASFHIVFLKPILSRNPSQENDHAGQEINK